MQSLLDKLHEAQLLKTDPLGTTYLSTLSEADDHKKALLERLNEDENLLLEQLLRCQDDIWSMDASRSFAEGFRLGSLLMLEILEKNMI